LFPFPPELHSTWEVSL